MLYNALGEGLIRSCPEIIVIGHKNPDSDTVCAAITYANLQNKIGVKSVPMVSGRINNETAFILKTFGVAVPEVLSDAAGKDVVMVDHSSYGQAVNGMKDAHILGIIDHHALGDVVTSAPLIFRGLPIGSTASIIYIEYQEHQVELDKTTAGLLLSAIISDTVNLTSSTTTNVDREIVKALLPLTGIADLDAYYKDMADAAASYDNMSNEEIYNADYKEFTMGSKHVGISQVNMKDSTKEEITSKMNAVLPVLFPVKKMDMLFCLATDLENKRTEVLCFDEGAFEAAEKAFGAKDSRIFVEKVVSRKKDIVPKLMEIVK